MIMLEVKLSTAVFNLLEKMLRKFKVTLKKYILKNINFVKLNLKICKSFSYFNRNTFKFA